MEGQAPGGKFSIQCRATSTRRATHTPSCAWTWSRNRPNAAILAGLVAYALLNAALKRGGAPARESDSAQATLDFTEGGGAG